MCRILFVAFLIFINADLFAKEVEAGRRESNTLPDSLSIDEFSALIDEISERSGEFHSENFVSNEASYLHPLKTLHRLEVNGGVYLGVGPEQNFTYIAETKPELAFIVDIRRQNMILHLVYKALFNLTNTRAEFISRLFSIPQYKDLPFFSRLLRAKPPWIDSESEPTIKELLDYFNDVEPDKSLYERNLQDVLNVIKSYNFLSYDDLQTVETIYSAFFTRQLDMQYDFNTTDRKPRYPYPTLRSLLLATTLDGEMNNFLARQETYSFLKKMHSKNLIIPVVGDFAGDKALRNIAEYVRTCNATLSVFYTSNVEFYLATIYPLDVEIQQRDGYNLFRFLSNMALMPIDESSVFVRAYHNDLFAEMMSHPNRIDGHVFTTIVQSISQFIEDESWQSYRGYDRYVRIVTTNVIE